MKQIDVFFGNETNRTVYYAHTGVYRIECWGGEGALTGRKGGYVSGDIFFSHAIKLYLFVGDEGKRGTEGEVFNNGGVTQYQGGGASDVRLVNDDYDEFESLKSRIIVAGGGGGSDSIEGVLEIGGDAGGTEGYPSASGNGKPGTQEAGGEGSGSGSFGKGGGNGKIKDQGDEDGNGGGGGGYFGGGGSIISTNGSGGGGSSYISGHNGCLAIDYSSRDQSNYNMTKDSIHYSGFSFFNTVMIDGRSEMPSPFKKGNETGHSSFGVIRITVLYTNLCKTNTNKWRMDIFVFIMLPFIY